MDGDDIRCGIFDEGEIRDFLFSELDERLRVQVVASVTLAIKSK